MPKPTKKKSVFDVARIFDPSFNSSRSSNNDSFARLEAMIEDDNLRRSVNVSDGRRATFRVGPVSAEDGEIVVEACRPEVQAFLDASEHKRISTMQRISDGRKETYHPTRTRSAAYQPFSYLPAGASEEQIRQFEMNANLQALLDASDHRRNNPMYEYREKPPLPQYQLPLPPTETTFRKVRAPKLTVDMDTYEPAIHPKTHFQRKLLLRAIKQRTWLLRKQNEDTNKALVAAMEQLDIMEGEVLQQQGEISDRDDNFYIVQEGDLEVEVDGVIIGALGAGDTIGQERLLVRRENKATIRAKTSATIFRLDQMNFRAIMQHRHQALMEELEQRMSSDDEFDLPGRGHRSFDDDLDDNDDDEADFHDEDDSFPPPLAPVASPPTPASTLSASTGGGTARKEFSIRSVLSITEEQSLNDTKPKAKKLRRPAARPMDDHDDFNFEDSPVFRHQQALRGAAQRHAATKDDLEFIRVLGEGQFGEVWLVAANLPGLPPPDDQSPRKEFALKIQQMDEDDEENYAEDMIRQEITALQSVHHPFVVNLVNVYEEPGSIDLLLGLIPGGELWEEIHREVSEGTWQSGLPEGRARFVSYVLADTLSFLHSREFVFRDLKPENVMIDHDRYPILVDFGFAKKVPNGDKTFTFCGTPNYVAPEIITNEGHNGAVDFWALGIVIYEMISGENPFFYDGMEQADLYASITDEAPYAMTDEKKVSFECLSLIDGLLRKDPLDRLGSQQILSHPWFRGMPTLQDIRSKAVKAVDCENLDAAATAASVMEEETPEEVAAEEAEDEDESTTDDDFEVASTSSEDEWMHRPEEEKPEAAAPQEEDVLPAQLDTSSPVRSKSKINVWVTPKAKGTLKGYFVNALSPEQRQRSQARRSSVQDILSQYTGNDEDEDLEMEDMMNSRSSQFMNSLSSINEIK